VLDIYTNCKKSWLEGNDVLEGGKGADYFDCGEGIDIVLDFEPANEDIIKNDCETS
jgi:RTX calcium-binding nonapeptide repeat (4 copies)